MYPHPELNSFLQGFEPRVPKKVLDRMVDKGYIVVSRLNFFFLHFIPIAMPSEILAKLDENTRYGMRSTLPRLASTQPQCFAPNVDSTRAKCAFGTFAVPKLVKKLPQ